MGQRENKLQVGKIESNNRKRDGKSPSIWKLNNTF